MNLECPICCQLYNLCDLEPMSLKCGHTLCKECCNSYDRCPYDRKPVDLSQITKNYGLISLIEDFRQRAAKLGLDMIPDGMECKMHNIERSLFCITDNIAVCAECVLFGDHSGHNIKKIEDLKSQGFNLLSGMNSTKESIDIESLLNTEEELKKKSLKIQDLKSKTIKTIEQEFSDFVETLTEEKNRLIKQVEDLYQIAHNNLNQCLTAKKELARANSELLLQQKASLNSLNTSGVTKDINKLVQKLSVSEQNTSRLKKLTDDLKAIDSRYKIDEIAKAISLNIDQTFHRKSLTDETPTGFIVRKVNLLEDFCSAFDKYDDLRIFVRNAPLSLNELSISELLKSCGPVSSLKIGNTSSAFNGSFKVEFEDPEAAKRFLFLNGVTIDRKPLQINYDTMPDPEKGYGVSVMNAEKKKPVRKDSGIKVKPAPKYNFNQFTRGIYADDDED